MTQLIVRRKKHDFVFCQKIFKGQKIKTKIVKFQIGWCHQLGGNWENY